MNDSANRRIEALRKILRAEGEGAGGILVASVANVTYLTGFTGDSSVLLVLPDRAIVVSDGRYTEQLERECPGLECHIRPVGQALYVGVAEVAGRLGLQSLAFESASLTVAEYQVLKDQIASVETRPTRGWVERLRMVKDGNELAMIRESISLAERSFVQMRDGLNFGQTEKDLADNLEFAMRRAGASGSAFPPILAIGANAALPHYRPGTVAKVGDSDFLLVDWGAVGPTGYRSDLTRMIVTGKFTDHFTRVYNAVLEAQSQAISAIRPGRTAGEVNAKARASLNDAGLGQYFTHGLGHGFGLEIHEMPFMGRDPDVRLEPGMVLTVEPGVYLPGWGGIRIEDDVLVTSDGVEVLTSLPRDLSSTLRPV